MRINSENTKSTVNKDYKEKIEIFRALIMLIYKKLELKKSFDVFREKPIKYTIKELKNSEEVIMLIQDLVDHKALFDANNKHKDLTSNETDLR